MGKALRIASLFILSMAIVIGGAHEADAKKKEEENT